MKTSSFIELKKLLHQKKDGLPKIKIFFLANSSSQFLIQAIEALGFENGFDLEISVLIDEQLDLLLPNLSAQIEDIQPEFVLLYFSTCRLLDSYDHSSLDDKKKLASLRVKTVLQFIQNIQCNCIYLNHPEIDDKIYGNYGNKVQHAFLYQLRTLNLKMMELAVENAHFHIADIANLQSRIGRERFHSGAMYYSSSSEFSFEAIPEIADTVIKIMVAFQGKFNKCLILDLDNTLWGGIIGDDGLEGIQIGNLGIGKVFVSFQNWIKKLKDRGILLAVCSKNEAEVAKDVFLKHPDMVLKLEDFAVFVANWNNKADNIRYIQSILNIGFDAMVFLDDNPVERSLVQSEIPDLCIPDLPEDPAEYLSYLCSLNLFETTTIETSLDQQRSLSYQNEAERAVFNTSFANEDEFLKSLSMSAKISGITDFNIPRIAQLSQRTNQFNLNTIRMDHNAVKQLRLLEDHFVFCISLNDNFGDYGLVSVIILEKMNNKTLHIKNWMMSCRVFNRGLENYIINHVVDFTNSINFKYVIGSYTPNKKNKFVENLYIDLGFLPVSNGKVNQYSLGVDHFKLKKHHIQNF